MRMNAREAVKVISARNKKLYTDEEQASVQLAAHCVKFLRRNRLMTSCHSVDEISLKLAGAIRRYRALERKIN